MRGEPYFAGLRPSEDTEPHAEPHAGSDTRSYPFTDNYSADAAADSFPDALADMLWGRWRNVSSERLPGMSHFALRHATHAWLHSIVAMLQPQSILASPDDAADYEALRISYSFPDDPFVRVLTLESKILVRPWKAPGFPIRTLDISSVSPTSCGGTVDVPKEQRLSGLTAHMHIYIAIGSPVAAPITCVASAYTRRAVIAADFRGDPSDKTPPSSRCAAAVACAFADCLCEAYAPWKACSATCGPGTQSRLCTATGLFQFRNCDAGSCPSATGAPPKTPAPAVVTNLPTPLCERDPQCFDSVFGCSECCTTGKAMSPANSNPGKTCWDATYTPNRCCNVPFGSTVAPLVAQTSTAPTTFPVVTPQTNTPIYPQSSSCPYVRDPMCFDNTYRCEPCCSTGKTLGGVTCWDYSFTQARCCLSTTNTEAATGTGMPSYYVTTAMPSVSSVGAYVKDSKCFDETFPAYQCCLGPGLNIKGVSCWDATYTFARCCVSTQAPITLATRAPSLAPVASVLSSCSDAAQYAQSCSAWVQLGYCTNPTYMPFMRTSCARSCGLCTGTVNAVPATPPPVLYPPPVVYTAVPVAPPVFMPVYIPATPVPFSSSSASACGDTMQACSAWVQMGYCLNPSYTQLMRTTCTLGCGFCTNAVQTSCLDQSTLCPSFAQAGACSGASAASIRQLCPQSCGACTRRAESTQFAIARDGVTWLDSRGRPVPTIDEWLATAPETANPALQGTSDPRGQGLEL